MDSDWIILFASVGLALLLAVAVLSSRDRTRRRPPQRREAAPAERKQDAPVERAAVSVGRFFSGGKGAVVPAQVTTAAPWAHVQPYLESQSHSSYLALRVGAWERQTQEYRRRHGLKEDGSDDPRFAGLSADTTPRNWPPAESATYLASPQLRHKASRSADGRAARSGTYGSARHAAESHDDNALGFVMGATTGVPIPLNAGSIMGMALHQATHTPSYDSAPSHTPSPSSYDSGSSSSGGSDSFSGGTGGSTD